MNPIRLYMKEDGALMIDFIRELVDNVEGRLIRIIGEGEGQFAPLLKDDLAEDYDVIIEEAKSEANQDREDLKSLTSMLQSGVIQPTPLIQQALIEKSPMREELKQEIVFDMKKNSRGRAKPSSTISAATAGDRAIRCSTRVC